MSQAEKDLFGELMSPAAAGEGVRGPGRPAGARNRRTDALRRFAEHTGKHPFEILLEIARADPIRRACELDCKPIEIERLRKDAAGDALAYLEQKLPQAVELPDGSQADAVIVVGAATVQQLNGVRQDMGFDLVSVDVEEIQDVKEIETVRQSDDKSDDETTA